MSTTDQAFLRAYRDPAAKPRPIAAAARSQMAQPLASPVPVPSSTPESTVVEIGLEQLPLERFATIHVAAGAAIPAPHADFSPRLAESPAAALPGGAAGQTRDQSRKRSLSSFTVAVQTAVEPPKPALEVDEVRWPAVCKNLLTSQRIAFEGVQNQLQADLEPSHNVIGITAAGRGEGCTTLALCLARHIAAAGGGVALVDADFALPQIAPRLGLSIEGGWETAIEGRNSVWEVMIESKADRLAILPLMPNLSNDGLRKSAFRAATDLHELAEQYDMVIVDVGPLAGGSPAECFLQPGSGIDGWIVVHDVRRGSGAALASLSLRLADAKQMQFGIAEMFVSSQRGSQGEN